MDSAATTSQSQTATTLRTEASSLTGAEMSETLTSETAISNMPNKSTIPGPKVLLRKRSKITHPKDFKAGGDHNQLSEPNLKDEDTSSKHSSFNDIVELDEEGHPYIDINRLVYHPQKHLLYNSPHLRKEKLIWYLPDFTFVLLNLFSLCISTYFILAGITSLSWVASIGMFSLPNCEKLLLEDSDPASPKESNFYFLPCLDFFRDPEHKFNFNNTGYNMSQESHSFRIINTKLTNIQTFGLIFIGFEIVNIMNVMVGINACLHGYIGVMSHHITVDGIIVLGEFVVSAIISYTGICEQRQLEVVRMLLGYHIRWYDMVLKTPEDESDKEKLINLQVDALQLNLGCCGVDSWLDYLPADWPYWDWSSVHSDLDAAEMVIPYSCCRSWWIRNIYCSHGAHLWAHPAAPKEKVHQFHERIVQEGCIFKLEQTCERMKLFMGKWAFVATITHLVCIVLEAVAAQVLIKNINNLIEENKKFMKRKEMTHDPGDSGSDLDVAVEDDDKLSKKDRVHWTKIPPPTEDEILTIKQRSNFNRFMANVKGGIVGRWMKEAHRVVTHGHNKPED